MNIADELDTIHEPYFGTEDVSELGYSFENAVSCHTRKKTSSY